jgi:hypothetical protein
VRCCDWLPFVSSEIIIVFLMACCPIHEVPWRAGKLWLQAAAEGDGMVQRLKLAEVDIFLEGVIGEKPIAKNAADRADENGYHLTQETEEPKMEVPTCSIDTAFVI